MFKIILSLRELSNLNDKMTNHDKNKRMQADVNY